MQAGEHAALLSHARRAHDDGRQRGGAAQDLDGVSRGARHHPHRRGRLQVGVPLQLQVWRARGGVGRASAHVRGPLAQPRRLLLPRRIRLRGPQALCGRGVLGQRRLQPRAHVRLRALDPRLRRRLPGHRRRRVLLPRRRADGLGGGRVPLSGRGGRGGDRGAGAVHGVRVAHVRGVGDREASAERVAPGGHGADRELRGAADQGRRGRARDRGGGGARVRRGPGGRGRGREDAGGGAVHQRRLLRQLQLRGVRPRGGAAARARAGRGREQAGAARSEHPDQDLRAHVRLDRRGDGLHAAAGAGGGRLALLQRHGCLHPLRRLQLQRPGRPHRPLCLDRHALKRRKRRRERLFGGWRGAEAREA
mmetsp:Transcript_26696/g.63469  ORF Transcript_26696/g.63469 Transcript_26696/m.63469 type:complete len:364 (-) Transcript_26696:85-1176(-)